MSHHNMMDDQLSLVIYKLLLYPTKRKDGVLIFLYISERVVIQPITIVKI